MSNFQSYGNNLPVPCYRTRIDASPKYPQMEGVLTTSLGPNCDCRPYCNHDVARNFVSFQTIMSIYEVCIHVCLIL